MDQFKKKHSLESLFILILFAVFTITSFYVVLIGADVYKKTVENTNVNNELRSSFTYISNKVRMFDSNGVIYVKDIQDCPSIIFEETVGDYEIYNYVFYKDNYIYELTTSDAPEAVDYFEANKVTESNPFKISQVTDNLIVLEGNTSDGIELEFSISIKSEKNN